MEKILSLRNAIMVFLSERKKYNYALRGNLRRLELQIYNARFIRSRWNSNDDDDEQPKQSAILLMYLNDRTIKKKYMLFCIGCPQSQTRIKIRFFIYNFADTKCAK